MIKKKIMIVFGTRPEAIKMAPLVKALKIKSDQFDLKVCVTSQHRQMLDQVLQVFEIIPDFDLNIMKQNQNLTNLTSSILIEMNKVFTKFTPDMLLVHGDTTTTLATSLAAFYSSIPIGHVEAGLRTYDLKAPFPEEFNRQITTKVSKWHFTPTLLSKKNLLSEGVNISSITVTGNTVIDAMNWVLKKTQENDDFKKKIIANLSNKISFDWNLNKFILITAHRRENFGDGFFQICSAIKKLASLYPDIHFIYPVHLNPNVIKPVYEILDNTNNIHLIDPLEYVSFVYLLQNSYLVLTDSGGIQEEAPSLGKPVLVMRDVTERPEGIESGTVELVGSNYDNIVKGVSRLLDDKNHYQTMSCAQNPYGDGLASERIIKVLKMS
jgi:UDP-N-acetylglucosamine 2-epimerase (non-hydrolysing)